MKSQQPSSTDWSLFFEPLLQVTEVNRKAVQKLTDIQASYISFLLDSTIKQLRTLSATSDLKDVVEQQLKYISAVDSQWCATAEQELATARDAQQSINELLVNSYTLNGDIVEHLTHELAKH